MNETAWLVVAAGLYALSGTLFVMAYLVARPELKRRGWRGLVMDRRELLQAAIAGAFAGHLPGPVDKSPQGEMLDFIWIDEELPCGIGPPDYDFHSPLLLNITVAKNISDSMIEAGTAVVWENGGIAPLTTPAPPKPSE